MSAAGGFIRARPPKDAIALTLLLCAQLQLAGAYAVGTPEWQAPDEPAHFNYVAQVAEGRPGAGWPTITPADYPAEQIARIMARRLPPGGDIGDITYEDHQPPLYYALAAWVYRLPGATDAGTTRSRLITLRLTGALLSLLTTTLAWAWVRLGAPSSPGLALAAAGFVAFLPMHVALGATVNNDVLALPLMAAVLWVALARACGRLGPKRGLWAGGALLGAAMLTKLTIYVAAAPLALAGWIAADLEADDNGGLESGPFPWRRRVWSALAPIAIGVAVASPWWLRNMALYGPGDPWALEAHAQAVHGQPTTATFLAEVGLGPFLRRALIFTFDSFWGVFGWMSVFLPGSLYGALAALSLLCILALAAHLTGVDPRANPRGGGSWRQAERAAVLLGGVTAMGSALGLIAYNVHFVQHQGRYLFPALLPLATGVVLGARTIGRWMSRGAEARKSRSLDTASLAAWPLLLWLIAWFALLRYVLPGLRFAG